MIPGDELIISHRFPIVWNRGSTTNHVLMETMTILSYQKPVTLHQQNQDFSNMKARIENRSHRDLRKVLNHKNPGGICLKPNTG